MVALDESPLLVSHCLSPLAHSQYYCLIPDKEAAEGLGVEAAGRIPRAYRVLGFCSVLGAQGLGVTEKCLAA